MAKRRTATVTKANAPFARGGGALNTRRRMSAGSLASQKIRDNFKDMSEHTPHKWS